MAGRSLSAKEPARTDIPFLRLVREVLIASWRS